jgi:hypothetical protein
MLMLTPVALVRSSARSVLASGSASSPAPSTLVLVRRRAVSMNPRSPIPRVTWCPSGVKPPITSWCSGSFSPATCLAAASMAAWAPPKSAAVNR